MPLAIRDEGVFAEKSSAKDTYTVELPLAAKRLTGLRLEALPDPKLPGMGPGHAGGNFVITHIKAELIPPAASRPTARFVRITLPGKDRILSLAEVQVFSGSDNVALKGEAKQSSTEALIAHLKLEIEKLRRTLYGTRSERSARLLDGNLAQRFKPKAKQLAFGF